MLTIDSWRRRATPLLPPHSPVHDYVQPWGGDVAGEMATPTSAAVKNAPARIPEGAVALPDVASFDGPLQHAITDALPADQTFGWNVCEGQPWIEMLAVDGSLLGEPVTRQVLNRALESLGRPALD